MHWQNNVHCLITAKMIMEIYIERYKEMHTLGEMHAKCIWILIPHIFLKECFKEKYGKMRNWTWLSHLLICLSALAVRRGSGHWCWIYCDCFHLVTKWCHTSIILMWWNKNKISMSRIVTRVSTTDEPSAFATSAKPNWSVPYRNVV